MAVAFAWIYLKLNLHDWPRSVHYQLPLDRRYNTKVGICWHICVILYQIMSSSWMFWQQIIHDRIQHSCRYKSEIPGFHRFSLFTQYLLCGPILQNKSRSVPIAMCKNRCVDSWPPPNPTRPPRSKMNLHFFLFYEISSIFLSLLTDVALRRALVLIQYPFHLIPSDQHSYRKIIWLSFHGFKP